MAEASIANRTKTVAFAYHNMGIRGLDALLQHGFEIAMVFSHEDDAKEELWFGSVAEWCRCHDIPCHTPEHVNTADWIELLNTLQPDFLFSFYYRKLLCPEILASASRGTFNLHGSLLPTYRGRAPVNWAILRGETETGITLHHMVAEADAGDIVAQHSVPITDQDTALTVFRKLEAEAMKLLDLYLPQIKKGTAPRHVQDHSQATVFGKRRPSDGYINWHQSAGQIHNLIRAVTHPYPGAFTSLAGHTLYIWKAKLQPKQSEPLGPGEIGFMGSDAVVGTGQDSLVLEEISWRGATAQGPDIAGLLRSCNQTKMV